jgi:hypothetical protein
MEVRCLRRQTYQTAINDTPPSAVTRLLVLTTRKLRLKRRSFIFKPSDPEPASAPTYTPVGQHTSASPVYTRQTSKLSFRSAASQGDEVLTFRVTTRSNESSFDIVAGICFLRCSHHADEAKRCKMITLQSAMNADGRTVGSVGGLRIIRVPLKIIILTLCAHNHAHGHVSLLANERQQSTREAGGGVARF